MYEKEMEKQLFKAKVSGMYVKREDFTVYPSDNSIEALWDFLCSDKGKEWEVDRYDYPVAGDQVLAFTHEMGYECYQMGHASIHPSFILKKKEVQVPKVTVEYLGYKIPEEGEYFYSMAGNILKHYIPKNTGFICHNLFHCYQIKVQNDRTTNR